ncbi:DUF2171 domain-containing protein [Sphingosinicella terrae]|uniref:DUF2171 domain-containing protein n=1 Tax=Sphingosinicella terrae TaxID=2172047 RepID=UPI000E0D0920|nr:DUF2171 domain-containing protein [Sphingosinicella terrae]
MAHDDRYERGRWPERGEQGRGRDRGERPRPQRLGERNMRGETDDPDYGAARYGSGPSEGFGGEGYGQSSDPDSFFGAPGYDAGFGGPRFDRLDVGSTGTHGVHPVSSPYGADYRGAVGVTPGGGYGSSARRYAELGRRDQQSGGRGGHDPHYAEWRTRQLEQLDRDYDEYQREHQQRFEREFGAWRERRGQQRQAVGRVTEHMEVVGSDGRHVGTVDCTRGERIILTKSDQSAGGHHHSIPCGWIETVDDKVRLNISGEQALERWRDEENSGAFFESDRDRGGRRDDASGPHVLNRAFSGTYPDRDRDDR